MAFKDVKRELQQLENEKLIELLCELYKKNKPVKDFLDLLVLPNVENVYEKYKEKVYLAFFPVRGHNCKLISAQKAISDFKKAGASPELLSELMFFYVETGSLYVLKLYALGDGNIADNVYISFEKTFKKMLDIMHTGGFLHKFHERIITLINDTKDICLGDVFYFPYQDLTEFDQTIYEDE